MCGDWFTLITIPVLFRWVGRHAGHDDNARRARDAESVIKVFVLSAAQPVAINVINENAADIVVVLRVQLGKTDTNRYVREGGHETMGKHARHATDPSR